MESSVINKMKLKKLSLKARITFMNRLWMISFNSDRGPFILKSARELISLIQCSMIRLYGLYVCVCVRLLSF